MRASIASTLISLGLTLVLWTGPARSESDRDFVFTDLEGHLVVRFVGTGATGLDPSQAEEILNAEFSSMVHDRLRADLLFDDQPRDPEWAASMEPQIEKHVRHAGLELTDVITECRADACRVIIEQESHWTVPEHQAVLETVQKSLEAFVDAHRDQLRPSFMITAYYQMSETPHIKAFLQRIGHAPTP